MAKVVLKKCLDCGLEAINEDDLKLFRSHKNLPLGKQNLCLACYSKRYSYPGYVRRKKKMELFDKNLKTCRRCSENLPLSEFYKKKDGLGNVGTICRKCNYEISRKWRKNNLERSRNLNKRSTKLWGRKIRLKALIHLSGDPPECKRCGFKDFRALQVDHISGDGAEESKIRTNYTMYKYITTLPEEEARKRYQVLCANCNWIKRIQEGTEGGGNNTI